MTARYVSDDVRAMAAATRTTGTQIPSARALRIATQGTSGSGGDGEGQSYTRLDTRIRRGRQQLEHLFNSFNTQLERRGRDIEEHYRRRETQRQEQLREVHDLGQRLNEVSTDLMYLLGNMNRDSERYHTYIRQSENIESALQDLTDTVADSTDRVAEVEGVLEDRETGTNSQGLFLPALDRSHSLLQPNTARLSRGVRNRRPQATRVFREQLVEEISTSRETRVPPSGVRGHNTELHRLLNGNTYTNSSNNQNTTINGSNNNLNTTNPGAAIRVPHGEGSTTSTTVTTCTRTQRNTMYRSRPGIQRATNGDRPGNITRDKVSNGNY